MNKLTKLKKTIQKHREKNESPLYLDDDRDLCYTQWCDDCEAYILKGTLIELPFGEYEEEEIFEVIDEASEDEFVMHYSNIEACTCDKYN